MTLAILATGDEIIHGDTLNTNGHYIAKALSSDGIPLGLQVTCSDKEQDLADSIAFLAKNHSVIISIGGLGPTSDDRTRFAFSRYFNQPLIEHSEALAHVQARLKRANLPFDDGNRLQALFPENATLLPNPNGTAMGCLFTAQDKLIVLLPGPPRECLPMFNDFVLPRLQTTQHSHKKLLSWQLFGVAEGQVAAMLETALAGMGCNLGYRLDMPYLEFKARCGGDKIDQIKQIVDPLLAPFIISPPKQKASAMLRERLSTMNESVVILDSATGGVLETLLRCPENTNNVHFCANNQARFHFELSGVDAFWNGDKEATITDVLMKYDIRGEGNKIGFERHSIPFRGHSMVLHYAAEWLSFRMLHLIDQIH